jgi:hypothetical protein
VRLPGSRNWRQLWRIARILGNDTDAEDAVQNAYLCAFLFARRILRRGEPWNVTRAYYRR